MKRSPLPLLMGAIIGTQALLNGVSLVLPSQAHGTLAQLSKATTFISSAYAAEAAAVKYTCPMHPQIISDTPGKCPICGMDLVPISGSEHEHEISTPEQAQHAGAPIVEISTENTQKMGVRIEKVGKGSFSGDVRATGIVMENERSRHDLFSQVEGRVEDLKYSAVGDRVKKGDVFYTLVSPELTTLQNDYLAALSGGLKDMALAAANRMKLLGIDDQIITTLAKTRKAYDKVPFYIPADGILAKLEIKNGHYLKAGDEIGHIQDLSTVWVEAAVPEQNLANIKEKQSAKVTFTGNSKPYEAMVDYIYPTISAEARTGKVRLIVENKDGSLKPAGYATVEFASDTTTAPTEKLVVPSEAVLRSSTGSHVIIALGEGKFQARDVQTGMAGGGQTEILSGLKEGESVVVSSQFLIDSESSLKESLQKLSAPATPKQSAPAGMPGREMNNGK